MSRLIDADALYEEFNHNPSGTKIRGDATVEVVLVRQKIRYAPTVDAVPVVRCRECRNDCGIVGKSLGPDGFCSMGRKKMEGEK